MTPLSFERRIDDREVLREVARSMVRLHHPERLLKLITRFIDRELGLTHASILVFDEDKARYVFVDSKGSSRFPMGFLKFDVDHPLIVWFHHGRKRQHIREDYLYRPLLEQLCLRIKLKKKMTPETSALMDGIERSMNLFKAELIIPGYFKKSMIALLMLGAKKNGRIFTPSEISFFQTLAQDCSMAIKASQYHRNLTERNIELAQQVKEVEVLRKKEKETYRQILRALAQEVNAKDPYTYGHVNQVEYLGLMTAREMGVDLSEDRKEILIASLILHDVGKIGIPDHILQKPMRLDNEEWEIMKTHVEKGVQILEPLADFKEVMNIVHCHHERYDGTGYPRGLKGIEIPIESRIISCVDAFHAIVSQRSYSLARPVPVAFEELERGAGTQFDPQVVKAFIRAMKRELAKESKKTPSPDHPGPSVTSGD